MDERILIITDDQDLAQQCQKWLTADGGRVVAGTPCATAIRQFYMFRPSLVLLDMNGSTAATWNVLRHIREASVVPVLAIASPEGTANMVRAFDTGADAFLSYPLDRELLLAEMRAMSRRAPAMKLHSDAKFSLNGLEVDLLAHRVTLDGREVPVSPTEFRLLACLARNAGTLVGHRELLQHIWGTTFLNGKEYLKVYVHSLRAKLEKRPEQPVLIRTVRGLGYSLDVSGAQALAVSLPNKGYRNSEGRQSLLKRMSQLRRNGDKSPAACPQAGTPL